MNSFPFDDPADVSRAQSAMRIAWSAIEQFIDPDDREAEETTLAHMIARLVPTTVGEDELVERALAWYRQKAGQLN